MGFIVFSGSDCGVPGAGSQVGTSARLGRSANLTDLERNLRSLRSEVGNLKKAVESHSNVSSGCKIN